MSPSSQKFSSALTERNPAVDWDSRLSPLPKRALTFAERVSLWLESPIVKFVSDPRFNPLYHTGTITVFLLFVILFTGLYLTMFYPFGFTLSYEAVSNIEANLVGRAIRALHRYASDAAVVAALLHAWRTFFQDRFRGPRWLAWLTGVGMAVVVWVIGVTGYWLIWDSRAQVITQSFFDIFNSFSAGKDFIVKFIATAAPSTDWIFLLIVLLLHLGLSALAALFLWWHFKRMSRAKWFPPRYWMIVVMAALLLAAILVPAGMLPPANPAQFPASTSLDLFFLAYLPTVLKSPALVWGAGLAVVALLALLPWLDRRKKLAPVQLDLARCDGCTLCERDCPYKAIQMIPRADYAAHKFQAEINPSLCVSCGVCLGSCPENALSLGDRPLDPMWQTTLERVAQDKPARVVFTCERHAQLGGRARLLGQNDADALVVPFTCVAMANPKLAEQAVVAGASEVQFIGCPPEDCANREGNLWMQQRLTRERLPRLKPAFAKKIRMDWLSPLDFTRAFRKPNPEATAYNFSPTKKHARPLVALALILTLALAIQLPLSDWNATLFRADEATLTIILHHRSGLPLKDVPLQADTDPGEAGPTRLLLTVDGATWLDATYPMTGKGAARAASIFEQFRLPAGEHRITLTMYDRADASLAQVLFDQTIALAPRQILNLKFDDLHIGGDPLEGERIFFEASTGTNAGCRICHSLDPDVVIVGPSLAGVATRAETRVPGLTAEQYLRQSILEPNAFVVPGFPAGQMLQNFGKILAPEQIDNLVAFLLTLK
ncbi:MAG: cytochrome b N-terminal domain-containing protein [Chloroflexota bacterium]